MRIELSDHAGSTASPRFVVYAETPAERAVLQAFVRCPTDSKDAVERDRSREIGPTAF